MQHVEKILETLQWHNCHNFKFGCPHVIETKNLEEHQKVRIYRQIFCPYLSCEKKVSFKDIIDHTGTDHKNLTVETKEDEKTFLVSYGKGIDFIKSTSKEGAIKNLDFAGHRKLHTTPNRFRKLGTSVWGIEKTDAISFQVDRDIFIMEYGLLLL